MDGLIYRFHLRRYYFNIPLYENVVRNKKEPTYLYAIYYLTISFVVAVLSIFLNVVYRHLSPINFREVKQQTLLVF